MSHAKKAFIEEGSTAEYSLLNAISMTISYRYLQPPLTLATKYTSKQQAKLITNFNDIHYHVGHSKIFANLIAIKNLREEDRPLYDTFDSERSRSSVINIEIFDDYESSSAYRKLHLLPKNGKPNEKVADKNIFNKERLIVEKHDSDLSLTAPQPYT
ncbi:hypothetical protein [Psychrobacter sp. JCM 18901]|uniref:hypothetical protein n=1 Tax=Psychrobacter sp. JCM 18901 TaxID=1298609 RepID=UPI0021C49AB7|nr:hypothetical protein [Psychrobacter sp. JCM 18901]